MILDSNNYFSPEAMTEYWSVSQFKAFNRCEASALAELRGEYRRETTTALLVGSYVDAYYSGNLNLFREARPDIFNKRTGELKADFKGAEQIIDRINEDPLMVSYLKGDPQTILTAEIFDVPWKIKMDIYNGERIVDLKIVRDFNDIYDPGYGYRSWIEYWGYDIQGAIYQKVEQIASGRTEPLPFFIAAATKERVPDIKIIQIPQHVLDAALGLVEAKIDRFDLIKQGEVDPIRCETCDYCKATKKLKAPEIYELKEA